MEVRFNKPFMYTKFQLDKSMHSQVMAENMKCVKRRKYKKKVGDIKLFFS